MKLSIITINFNNCSGLQKTIESVISQTFKDFEWIVIDGGSTDGSRELIEQNANRFSYWVSEPDHGVYNAMNKGIKAAKGEYLQFLNSGDWLYNEKSLERSFSHSFTSDIVYGDVYLVDKNGEGNLRCYPKELTIKFFYDRTLCHNATFIRRGLLQEELYDESFRIVSDWLFFIKCALNNYTFEHIGETIICYDTSGISSVNKELVKQEREFIIDKLLPDKLVQDFERMCKMEAILNSNHVRKVMEFGEKKRLYHKMITGFFSFLEVLDKILK